MVITWSTKVGPNLIKPHEKYHKWNIRFLDQAEYVSHWSKDPSTQVGAVIANPTNKHIVGMGFNGFPSKIPDQYRNLSREDKLDMTIHAEQNAILHSTVSVEGMWLYTSKPCCVDCAKFVIASGIQTVFWYKPEDEFMERWGESVEKSLKLFDLAHVPVNIYERI